MLYASIDEVWGRTYQENNINNYKKKNIIEEFTESIKEEKNLSEIDCKKILKHIKKCPKCYKKLSNKFRPKILHLLHDIVDEYREVIVLILIGIFIMLFFNLLNNITK